jgi:hypothetical protein
MSLAAILFCSEDPAPLPVPAVPSPDSPPTPDPVIIDEDEPAAAAAALNDTLDLKDPPPPTEPSGRACPASEDWSLTRSFSESDCVRVTGIGSDELGGVAAPGREGERRSIRDKLEASLVVPSVEPRSTSLSLLSLPLRSDEARPTRPGPMLKPDGFDAEPPPPPPPTLPEPYEPPRMLKPVLRSDQDEVLAGVVVGGRGRPGLWRGEMSRSSSRPRVGRSRIEVKRFPERVWE